MASPAYPSPSKLETVFNHLVLPARLPGTHDPQDKVAVAFIDRLLDATLTLRTLTGSDFYHEWNQVGSLYCLFSGFDNISDTGFSSGSWLSQEMQSSQR